jgi:cysteine synthase
MSAKASWVATAVGTAVGTGGWIFGLGRVVWPAHPQWALFIITIAATIVTSVLVERNTRPTVTRAQH